MRLARKLFLLGVMALAALAMTAGTASAQVEVSDEATGDHCPTVVKTGNDVTGGCHAEFESEGDIPLFAYIPAKTTVSNCEVHLEIRVNETGEGYVTAAAFTDATGLPGSCTRRPCDTAVGQFIPWDVHILENTGAEEVEATFCIRTAASGPGGAQSLCPVHLALAENGTHHYEVGTFTETFCEVSPFPFPVSIQAHLESEDDPTESIEITH